ncbi:MAG: LytR/AlgR family response regulator transcription factor [Flavobacteriaceae bacterium]
MTIYILEDEPNILKYLLSLTAQMPYLQVLGHTDSIARAVDEIPKFCPELILADIQLTDGISFDLFEQIETNAQLIFITAYNQFAIKALNLGAFAYLLKPIDEKEFFDAIERCYKKQESFKFQRQQVQIAEEMFKQKDDIQKIALKNSDATYIVSFNDIVYCQSDKGYTTFVLRDGSNILVSKVIKEYESLLPSNRFIRCHQSYLVNTAFIKTFYKDGVLEMKNGDKVSVSERKKNQVVRFLNSVS